jgi:hypothetical protein
MLVGEEQRRVGQVDEGPLVVEKRQAGVLSFDRGDRLEKIFGAVPPQLCHPVERSDLTIA